MDDNKNRKEIKEKFQQLYKALKEISGKSKSSNTKTQILNVLVSGGSTAVAIAAGVAFLPSIAISGVLGDLLISIFSNN